ncbi:MAG: hypothetical protein HQ581_16360, partial [Planctomycetes bacterium]|nr:hypothetical protein [Planctomycetota bacterium]
HVYCQKPLTHSLYEARLMTETAAKMKVATQMGNQAHAGEPIRRAVELVQAGIIGPVREAHFWTNRPIWPQGVDRPADKPPVPAGLDWDLWLGPAPVRPYHPAYVPFKWRGFWDFGTGALGDMACHIIDMPYWALELGSPTSVEAVSQGATKESPPNWSTITYQFPARGEKPPVKLVWYDGKKDGKQNLPPAEIVAGQNVGGIDGILVGDKGKMYFQRRSTNWVITPDAILKGFEQPPQTIRRVKNEDAEWHAACKGGPAALSHFGYAGPLTETVLLGNLALRTGKRIEWDAKNLKATNVPEADPYIRREYRKGWTL